MRLKIIQAGEEVLRQIARPLTIEEIRLPDFQKRIESMCETMRDAPGVGLAAPQIGLSIQLVVIEDRPEYSKDIPPERLAERERHAVPFHVLVNPRVVERSERQVEYFEGCLSVTGFSALVRRAHSVVVDCWDEHGEPRRIEAHGWYARILQHEIDHLQGSLYVDRMEPRSFTTLENMNRHWKEVSVQAVRDALRIK